MLRQRLGRAVAVSLALGAATIVTPTQSRAAGAPPTLPTNCVQQTLGGTVTCTFASTGAEQSFAVPTGVTSLTVTAVGAAGGQSVYTPTGSPGEGVSVSGAVTVTPGATLYVEVGGAASASGCSTGSQCTGGFNGGGSSLYAGGGGGASDVRTVAGTSTAALDSRLIVAAGGGGTGTQEFCGADDRLLGGGGGDGGVAGGAGETCPGIAGASSSGGGPGTAMGGVPGSSTGPDDNGNRTTLHGVAGGYGVGGSYDAAGAGGGGVYGGGTGADAVGDNNDPVDGLDEATGGGGGGSSLVPAGGSGPTPTTAAASVTIAYTPGTAEYLTLSPAMASQPVVTGSQTYQAVTYDSTGASVADVTSGSLSASAGASCTGTSCTPLTLGDHTITATSGTLTATATLTGTVGPTAGLAASDPATATAGTAVSLVVTASDVLGDQSAYTGTVHFTSTDAKAVLPADYTFTAGDAGQHTFPVTFETSGSQTVTVTDTTTATLTGTTGSTTVAPGPAATITVSPAKASVEAGVAQAYTATGMDAYGNSLGDVTASTVFTIGPDGSCSGASCTPVSAGVHAVQGRDGAATASAELDVTAVPVPTPTPTPTPSPSTAPSPTPTPTPSPTLTPVQPPVSVTIHAGSKSVAYGKTVRLTGSVTRSGLPAAGAVVSLTETYAGSHAKFLTRVTTTANGAWSYTTRPAYTGTITAVSLGSSAATKVAVSLVVSKVTARVSGGRVTLTVRIGPGFTASKTLVATVLVTDAAGHRRTVVARSAASRRTGALVTNHGHNQVIVSFPLAAGGYHLAVTVSGAPASSPGTSRTIALHVG